MYTVHFIGYRKENYYYSILFESVQDFFSILLLYLEKGLLKVLKFLFVKSYLQPKKSLFVEIAFFYEIQLILDSKVYKKKNVIYLNMCTLKLFGFLLFFSFFRLLWFSKNS